MSGYFRQDFLQTPDGADLYFQVQGDGPLGVVLCDGLGCDGFVWKYLLPRLREQHRVLRWHYRGHGRSGLPQDPERLGMLSLCEDLTLIMDAVGMEDAVVFGHSMGVQVALEFHRRYASRVRGLALLCGSYGNPLDTFHDEPLVRRVFPFVRQLIERFPTVAARISKLGLSTRLAVRIALEMETNKELMREADLVPYFDHLAKMDPRVFARTLAELAEHSAWDHLPHVDVPTLVVAGERDTFTPMWLSRRLAEAIPGAEFFLVSLGTHTAPLEQPELVGRRVMQFLEERVAAQLQSSQGFIEPGELPDARTEGQGTP